ncbi:hypothetical protein ACHAPE_009823 [Trichoderma viride]
MTEPNAGYSAQVVLQFCQPGQNSQHIFGLIATGNGTFATVQDALQSWSKAECLTIPAAQNVTGTIPLVTPLYNASASIIGTNSTSTSIHGNATSVRGSALAPRANCTTIQVEAGDSCPSLAQRCGITPAQFTQYNPSSKVCNTAGGHVCCSAGSLPSYAPPPQSDGTCATYTTQMGDDCSTIAATYSLTQDDLNNFNKNTWGWSGCSPLGTGITICLSKGNPPMPAPISNAICGPQVPGTTAPPSGTNISTLNPCLLNACCDVWGQCGTTAEYCTDTGTGAPGTAAHNTNGCISNCGTNIVLSSPPSQYRNIAFFEGYNLQRDCLYQDIGQVDFSSYTHVYFSFGVLSPSYQVQIPNVTTQYEFSLFKQMSGAKRILSIGGWDFSTQPATYNIFRSGVTAANRLTMATNIANFINDNELDGINIDWEYPGAPDIPGIPPASTADGTNYLAFLAVLRNLLPNKEITIAVPASYWYLKGFPVQKMVPLLDYFIYMTYDLHGQWDSQNVNLTETIAALVMITKAGVPSNKVVVGVTSYGRSFAMAEEGCYGPQCQFLGDPSDSQATPGRCTQTSGYISNAEIEEILANSSRVNQNHIDTSSNTNILVYDDTQWVGWMSNGIKASRAALYKGLAMGGTTDWASDLQEFNDPPFGVSNWADMITVLNAGGDLFANHTHSGNWTELTCTNPAVENALLMDCSQRWTELDTPDAWTNTLATWKETYKNNVTTINGFTLAVMQILHGPEEMDCGALAQPDGSCSRTYDCTDIRGTDAEGNGGGSGPAAYLILNSFVILNKAYSQFYYTIVEIAATYIDNQMEDFELTFAPVPPEPSDEWLEILIALLGLGITAIAAPFFDEIFVALPALAGAGLDEAKDIGFAGVAYGASIAAATLPTTGDYGWDPRSEANFTATLGSVLHGWTTLASYQLRCLFNGSDTSTNLLTTLMGSGNLIEGSGGSPVVDFNSTTTSFNNLEGYINKAFFGFAIPAVWTASNNAAFIVDSGYACGTVNPLTQYMTVETQEATYSCYNGNLYYLASASGDWRGCTSEDVALPLHVDTVSPPPPVCDPTFFTAPPGMDALGPDVWGGLTIDDIVKGSVNTWLNNNKINGAPIANPLDPNTLDDLSSQNITTPGYIRLPVCSPQTAWASWSNPSQSNSSAPGYPCNALQGVTKCSGYTYVDQTSSASPLISDCQVLMSNIAGTNGDWTTGIGSQRNIASFGTCNFGVNNDGTTGDVTYHTGSQDIVTIITEAISQFGSNGVVGAKGTMQCSGNVNTQNVDWGLY